MRFVNARSGSNWHKRPTKPASSCNSKSMRHSILLKSDDAPDPEILAENARDAAELIDLDEADTRTLIDQQLRDAGWEANSPQLRYAKGTRPMKGKNRAIAEWPTMSGPADYALFCGLTLVGTIEAKRQNQNVMAVLRQAERYASDIHMQEAEFAEGGPWLEYKAPFAFSYQWAALSEASRGTVRHLAARSSRPQQSRRSADRMAISPRPPRTDRRRQRGC